ncbi:MAG: PQQ-dependent sugar dehydrogenase, partial [Myxococcota bacterium]
EEDARRAAVLRFDADGSGAEIYASGLRNSVGFDWRPETGELFATDNGRDLLGNDIPPCELNRIERGGFYGFPVANGDRNPDPDFGAGQAERIATSIPPVHAFRAHTAPLGITFVRDSQAPESMRGAALVAQHGSWNRTELSGYKVVSLHWDTEGRIEERDFMTGFNLNDDVIGRPVDIIEGPDGVLYLSDDYGGAIYRIAQSGRLMGQSATALKSRDAATLPNPLSTIEPAMRSALAERGEKLFAQHACGTCHLASTTASGVVAKPLSRLAAKFTVNSLSQFFLAPQPPMPVFALSEDDRRALAVHLLTIYPN